MKRYFITGTDTDCGKTYVTRDLIRSESCSLAIKPIACGGCSIVDNQLVSYDAQLLQLEGERELNLDVINPWTFPEPVSPHIAAELNKITLSTAEIAEYCLSFQHENIETLYIEGAGGLMVPLNQHETWIDFLKLSQIPVILVVGMKLGCINHALLTQNALQSHQIPCAGWIANCIDPQMQVFEENLQTLKDMLEAPLLKIVPFVELS